MPAKTILIVDDDADDREMLEEAFRETEKDSVIHITENGKAAIAWLNKQQQLPDFIFLDLNMPQMDGLQCLKKIRKVERFKDIAVIIYTTSKQEEDKKAGLELGATAFITKPNTFKALKKVVADILQHEMKSS